jgi:hypothetical protein
MNLKSSYCGTTDLTDEDNCCCNHSPKWLAVRKSEHSIIHSDHLLNTMAATLKKISVPKFQHFSLFQSKLQHSIKHAEWTRDKILK